MKTITGGIHALIESPSFNVSPHPEEVAEFCCNAFTTTNKKTLIYDPVIGKAVTFDGISDQYRDHLNRILA